MMLMILLFLLPLREFTIIYYLVHEICMIFILMQVSLYLESQYLMNEDKIYNYILQLGINDNAWFG